MLAMPAILVPAIEIPLVIWARNAFLARNPDYIDDPPTISRAISDPLIGGPFSGMILVITALILMALPMIIWAYSVAINRLSLNRGATVVMQGFLVFILVCQLAASAGMVLTTQYTFANNGDLHMLGSYIFFAFQALTILMAATLCGILLHQKQKLGITGKSWPFRPNMHRFRFLFGLSSACLTIMYGVLFVIKDGTLPVSAYAVQLAYTQCEVLVISSFVLFLGSYGVDIHHIVREDKLYLSFSRTPTTKEAGDR